MRTIKITKELKDFAENIYKVDFKARVDTIHNDLQSKFKEKNFKDPIVNTILRYLDKNLEALLIMSPTEMKLFISRVIRRYGPAMEIKVITKTDKSGKETFIKKSQFKYWLNKTFQYPLFREEIRVKLIEKIGLKTCPYCNAQLTIGFEKEDNKHGKATFQLDHYYPQTDFPFFSISFFNLIPCCGNCNQAKGDRDYELGKDFHLYTENDAFSFFKFEVEKVSKAKFLLSKQEEDLKIEFKGKYKDYDDKANHHNTKFSIEEIYNTQKDVAEELFQKKVIYTDGYKKDLKKLLGDKWNKTASLDRLILGNYHLEEDIHKRPLAKFTQDIARELKLIK